MSYNNDLVTSWSISAKNNALKTDKQSFKAYVVANVGDPGLQVDDFCDIRSRFVIAVKDPQKKMEIPESSDGSSIFLDDNVILVMRPKTLWINCPLTNNLTDMSKFIRTDANGLQNIGSALSGFTENVILPINRPYTLGEEITVKKLQSYWTADNLFFQSVFPMDKENGFVYANSSRTGMALPNKLDGNGKIISGGRETLSFSNERNYYFPMLLRYYYEYFIQQYFGGKVDPIFTPSYKNEYYFKNKPRLIYRCLSYVDANDDGKARDNNSACLPTIVAPPDSFLTAKTRESSLIYYNRL